MIVSYNHSGWGERMGDNEELGGGSRRGLDVGGEEGKVEAGGEGEGEGCGSYK